MEIYEDFEDDDTVKLKAVKSVLDDNVQPLPASEKISQTLDVNVSVVRAMNNTTAECV